VIPKCIVCGKRIPPEFRGTKEHAPLVHSQACARVLLQRILISVPDVASLLPAQWRHAEWEAQQKWAAGLRSIP
jgi:hypothetical protein